MTRLLKHALLQCQNTGLFLGVGYLAGDVLESWSVRLGLSQDEVAELVAEQPALLEMSPNTVKSRLVGQLCIVFDSVKLGHSCRLHCIDIAFFVLIGHAATLNSSTGNT